MTLSRTLYETIPGSPTSKLTQAYFSGVSENIIIENGNIEKRESKIHIS